MPAVYLDDVIGNCNFVIQEPWRQGRDATGRSVNPISTRRADFAHPLLLAALALPNLFFFQHGCNVLLINSNQPTVALFSDKKFAISYETH